MQDTLKGLSPEEHAALEERRDALAQQEELQRIRSEMQQGRDVVKSRRVIAAAALRASEYIREVQETKAHGKAGKIRGWLRKLEPDVAALIAVQETVRRLQADGLCSVQELANSIGREFHLEAQVQMLLEADPMQEYLHNREFERRAHFGAGRHRQLWKAALKTDKVQEFGMQFTENLQREEYLHLGKEGVQACIAADLVQLRRVPSSKGVRIELYLHPDIETYLHELSHKDVQHVLDRLHTPMLAAPEPWTGVFGGGYHSTARKARYGLVADRRLRWKHRDTLRAELTAQKRPELFRIVNYLQGIAYSMHEPTRKAIVQLFQQGGGVMQVPRRQFHAKPACPFPESWVRKTAPKEEQGIFGEWLSRARQWHNEERRWRRDVRLCSTFLQRVTRDNGYNRMWFPVFLDSRGRMYYRGNPNPQGDDKSKAVLHFADKRKLGPDGVFWIKVQIANSLGYDKAPLRDRAAYVDTVWDALARALDAPQDSPEVFGDDSPWCVFAAAWELREAFRSGNPAEYETGLPVHQDASCSGHQFWALLMHDPEGAHYTNLTPAPQSSPKRDIYAKVADEAVLAMLKDTSETTEEYREFWKARGITRQEAKSPVMTIVYSATQRSQAMHLEGMLRQDPTVRYTMNPYRAALYAVGKLFDGVAKVAPSAMQGMHYVQGLAKQARKAGNEVLRWENPVGMLCIQDYPKYETRRVMLRSCGVQEVLFQRITPDVDSSKMTAGVAPNFVHSLDAALAGKVAQRMQAEGLSFVSIHDSFGTTPGEVGLMRQIIREELYKLFTEQDPLDDFRAAVHPEAELPERGNLDLKLVLNSQFCFS